MPAPKFKSIDDYELFLSETAEKWTPQQRTAMAAAMAERWLPQYDKFAEEEEWGDAAGLRRSLEAVWNHLLGKTLGTSDRKRHLALIDESTPHMDDFDAEEALAACVALNQAVRSCGSNKNHNDMLQASLSGFEAVMPDWLLDPDSQPRIWHKGVVRKELRKQLKLIDDISAITRFDAESVAALRAKLATPEYAGVPTPRDEEEKPAGPTNQEVFEQHRRMVEADIRGDERTPTNPDLQDDAYLKAIIYFSKWASRYSRRLNNTNGEYSKLADTAGLNALLARQRALDTTVPEMPDWDDETLTVFEMCMANRDVGLETRKLEEPHSYGPSLRRLWGEAKTLGKSDDECWQGILDWARQRPPAWAVADARKKKGRAMESELGEKLGTTVVWNNTENVFHPWAAEVDGQRWQVRINDFPEDYMYSLVIDGTVIGDFHDWPETWQR